MSIELLEARLSRLEDDYASLKQEHAELKQDYSELQVRYVELESKYKKLKDQNSDNSSQPPSQDKGKPNKNPSLKKSSGRKPGGQKGHPPANLAQFENPDEVFEHRPSICYRCRKDLSNCVGEVKEVRQEIDIPEIKAKVTEHRSIEVKCGCGFKNRGSFPKGINPNIQYGPNLQASALYLRLANFLPYERSCKLLSDLVAMNISEGTVENIMNRALKFAKPWYGKILSFLQGSSYVGSDETGIRVDGKNWWLWVWQNTLASFYVADPRRAYLVVKENFGEEFKGILGHDCYSAQNNTEAKDHQHCHPHYLRPLKYSIESEESKWAQVITDFLYESQAAQVMIWSEGFNEVHRQATIDWFNGELEELLKEKIPENEKVAIRIQKRMKKHKEKVLAFLKYPDVPPDNNGSERAIRIAKIQKKISGCFRNPDAATRNSILLSVIETAKKQGLSTLQACKQLFNGQLVLLGG